MPAVQHEGAGVQQLATSLQQVVGQHRRWRCPASTEDVVTKLNRLNPKATRRALLIVMSSGEKPNRQRIGTVTRPKAVLVSNGTTHAALFGSCNGLRSAVLDRLRIAMIRKVIPTRFTLTVIDDHEESGKNSRSSEIVWKSSAQIDATLSTKVILALSEQNPRQFHAEKTASQLWHGLKL